MSVTLEQYRDEASYIGMVTKHKRNKKQPRILIIGHNRILSIRPGGKLARQAHLLDLLEISSSSKSDVRLIAVLATTRFLIFYACNSCLSSDLDLTSFAKKTK